MSSISKGGDARQLIAFLKAKPGAYNYASSGNGTIIHLAGAMFVAVAYVDEPRAWEQATADPMPFKSHASVYEVAHRRMHAPPAGS